MSAERLFYDGDCGVCHWAVAFTAQRDPDGRLFRFAPIGGETFEQQIPADLRHDLPDSIVIRTQDGKVLLRSAAIVHILRRLGGVWALLGALMGLIPRPLRDFAYSSFARVRHLFVRKPEGVCPLLPPELRGRFDL